MATFYLAWLTLEHGLAGVLLLTLSGAVAVLNVWQASIYRRIDALMARAR